MEIEEATLNMHSGSCRRDTVVGETGQAIFNAAGGGDSVLWEILSKTSRGIAHEIQVCMQTLATLNRTRSAVHRFIQYTIGSTPTAA